MSKFAIYSLTMDRLEYTKHCFKTLREKAGYPFDHYVVDNGSKDGTVDWLLENQTLFKKIILNDENVGIGIASNQALNEIFKEDYDFVIKVDNDCEVVSEHILSKIADVYGEKHERRRFDAKYILSPRVEGIDKQPVRKETIWIGKYEIGFTNMVGGLFMVTPSELFKNFRYREDMRRIGLDSHICSFANHNGARCGYIENLVVNHYETTKGQVEKYPEYFKLKFEEQDKEIKRL